VILIVVVNTFIALILAIFIKEDLRRLRYGKEKKEEKDHVVIDQEIVNDDTGPNINNSVS